MKEVWRHDLSKHSMVFIAVANILEHVQIMETGVWEVDCNYRTHNDISI